MYRAVTLYLIEHNIALDDERSIQDALQYINIDFRNDTLGLNQTYLNETNVETLIRNIKVSRHVAQVAAFSGVRIFLIEQQKQIASS